MSDRPEDLASPAVEVPSDAPEADALDQALPWAPDAETADLPEALPRDAAEGDALDQARDVDLGSDEEEPA